MLVGTMRAAAAAALLCIAWSACASPIGEADARHLLNRTGFGATDAEVHALAPLDRREAIDRLLAETRREASLAPAAFVDAAFLPFYCLRQMAPEERR